MDTDTILQIKHHRPWPVPTAPWLMRQSWRNLLFAHWRADPDGLRSLIPEPLVLDLHGSDAWVGLVPFEIRDLGVRNLPGIPTATNFLELNLRTYVRCGERAGVYFFTLEASSAIAVAAAKTLFRLPYHDAEMSMTAADGWVSYRCTREGGGAFEGRYRPTGHAHQAAPGSLDEFLTERYALFTARNGEATAVQIHHPPWSLHSAEAALNVNTIADAHGIALLDEAPLLHFVAEQNMVNWAPEPANPTVS